MAIQGTCYGQLPSDKDTFKVQVKLQQEFLLSQLIFPKQTYETKWYLLLHSVLCYSQLCTHLCTFLKVSVVAFSAFIPALSSWRCIWKPQQCCQGKFSWEGATTLSLFFLTSCFVDLSSQWKKPDTLNSKEQSHNFSIQPILCNNLCAQKFNKQPIFKICTQLVCFSQH